MGRLMLCVSQLKINRAVEKHFEFNFYVCTCINNRVINNTASGNCGSRQWQNGPERKTMATYLQADGYATFYGGKYLNQVI